MARKPTRRLTHFDRRGHAHMVDVGAKAQTHRLAVASGRILMRAATLRAVAAGRAKKGDVLGVARIAAIQAAKRTPELIPLAHPIVITRVVVAFTPEPRRGALSIAATVACRGRRARGQVRTRAADQNRSGERDHARQLHLLLRAEHARYVALRDVRDLVRQHGGELGLALRGIDQAGVHADETSGQRERVDRRVADGEELEILARPRDCGEQPPAQPVEVAPRSTSVDGT